MATIHQLPGAAAVPPVQVRGKGRFPKHVVPLYRGLVIQKRRALAERTREECVMKIAFHEFRAQDYRAELQQLTKG